MAKPIPHARAINRVLHWISPRVTYPSEGTTSSFPAGIVPSQGVAARLHFLPLVLRQPEDPPRSGDSEWPINRLQDDCSTSRGRCSRNLATRLQMAFGRRIASSKPKRVLQLGRQSRILLSEVVIAPEFLDPALAEYEEDVVPRFQRPADPALEP